MTLQTGITQHALGTRCMASLTQTGIRYQQRLPAIQLTHRRDQLSLQSPRTVNQTGSLLKIK
jgi:hypothetical protein